MAHNIVYYDTSTNSIVKMSTADVDTLANYVLEYMVGLGSGALGFIDTTAASGGSSIGVFYDYWRNAGSTDTTLYANTLSLYQIQTQQTGSYSPNMVGLDVSGSPTIVLQSNLMTQTTDLADEIIDRMNGGTYGGVGSYWFTSNNTAPADGGTWVGVTSFTNLVDQNTNGGVSYLWRKTNNGSTTTITKRPLKLVGNELVSLTDVEIRGIVAWVEQRMTSTGKGFYQISSTTPATGTWVQAGTLVTDTTRSLVSAYYAGTYVPNYLGIGPDGTQYNGPTAGSPLFLGPGLTYVGAPADGTGYVGPWVFTGTTTYTGTASTSYTGPGYTGPIEQNFIGAMQAIYTGALAYTRDQVNYAGPYPPYPNGYPFSGYFTGPGPAFFAGPPTAYTGTGTYIGPGPAYYVGDINYTGNPWYSGPGPVVFAGSPIPASFAGATVSPTATEFVGPYYTMQYLWRRVA